MAAPPAGFSFVMEREKVGSTLCSWPSGDDNVLFNAKLLSELDVSQYLSTDNGSFTVERPGPDLRLRPLEKSDYDKGYMSLLSQLTRVGEVSKERFEAQFECMKQCIGGHYIVVVEDISSGRAICSASLAVERKFIHATALRARLEDVVVDKDYRGRHLGGLLVGVMTELSRHIGCYKVSLDCAPDVQEFYKKFGYKHEKPLFLLKRFYD